MFRVGAFRKPRIIRVHFLSNIYWKRKTAIAVLTFMNSFISIISYPRKQHKGVLYILFGNILEVFCLHV